MNNNNPLLQPGPAATSGPYCFTVPFARRILFFILIAAASLLVMALAMIPFAGETTVRSLRVMTVIQDLFLFILPPVATAVVISRRPASLLAVDRGVGPLTLLLAAAGLIVSIPAMNMIVEWNESLTLPESLAGLEERLRAMEEAARDAVLLLMGDHNAGSFIMAVLIMGIMAGLSEELFFRAGIQRLLSTGPVNPHVAIWLTAFIFSAIHMQFYGFVPRLLLGAYFGYLLWWSGSVWLPVAIHALNNTMVIIGEFTAGADGTNAVDTIGTGGSSADILTVCASVAAFAATILLLRRRARRSS
ncbi:MAG: CPBP family intramembrane metalloprotease [Clostridium sp.]|nr:CPBP family intramembrane metalloprotease [Clostridium sp.]